MTTKKLRTWPDEETSSPSLVDALASPRPFHLDVPYLAEDRKSDSEHDLDRLQEQYSRRL